MFWLQDCKVGGELRCVDSRLLIDSCGSSTAVLGEPQYHNRPKGCCCNFLLFLADTCQAAGWEQLDIQRLKYSRCRRLFWLLMYIACQSQHHVVSGGMHSKHDVKI